MKKTSDLPSMEISCRTCSRNRYIPVCLGGGPYCRIPNKPTSGSWLPRQPQPTEPCMDYNPSRSSFIAAILDWQLGRQERKERVCPRPAGSLKDEKAEKEISYGQGVDR